MRFRLQLRPARRPHPLPTALPLLLLHDESDPTEGGANTYLRYRTARDIEAGQGEELFAAIHPQGAFPSPSRRAARLCFRTPLLLRSPRCSPPQRRKPAGGFFGSQNQHGRAASIPSGEIRGCPLPPIGIAPRSSVIVRHHGCCPDSDDDHNHVFYIPHHIASGCAIAGLFCKSHCLAPTDHVAAKPPIHNTEADVPRL